MNKIFAAIISILFCLNLYPDKLLDRENVFDAENKDTKIEKIFIYDADNNIIETRDFRNGKMDAKYVYSYVSGKLQGVEEYVQGVNKIITSKFEYNESSQLSKKTDFDKNTNPVMYHEYIYSDKTLTGIKDYLPDKTYIGEKSFLYSGGKLTEEHLIDNNGNKMLIKKYSYKNGVIDVIDYYSFDGNKIRTVKRNYLNKKAGTSVFGYRDNFYDFR